MSSSKAVSPRKLGDKFQLRRSNTREASDMDNSRQSSSFDPDSSFASSSAASADNFEEKITRAKVGGLGALGARVRSMSTSQKKSQGGEEKATPVAILPKVNRSKSSISNDAKKSSRSSRLFDALGFKSKAESAEPMTSPGLETEDVSPAEPIPQTSTPRPRLSVSGLSGRFNRTSSYFSLDTASPTSGISEIPTSPGDFNLRSFRNVRRQDSSGSPAIQSASKSLAVSPLPMSSASQYNIVSPSDSRPESFLSAEDSQQHSSATSPRFLSPSNYFPDTDTSPSESKQSSPRMDAMRFQGGSIAAGRFRKVNAGSVRNSEDTGGTSTPTEGAQRSMRPSSPFTNMTSSPSQALAALEAEMAKGRTTPLMFMHQGEDSKGKITSPEPRSPSKSTKDNFMPRQVSGEGLQSYQGIHSLQSRSLNGEGQEIAPPKLPWLRDEAEMPKRRQANSNGYTQFSGSKGELLSPLANVNPVGDMRDVLSRGSNGSTSPPVDQNGTAFPKSRALSASPTDLHHQVSSEEISAFDIGRRIQRWSMFNGAKLNGTGSSHRRGESTPLDTAVARSSPQMGNHRRATSAFNEAPTNGQMKTDELLSFHEQQAPLLSAAQSRTEIVPKLGARIAWPSPPCIKLEYFSHLSALHQHSLYEQHCKAADHALAEYLRLMEGVVPSEAMTHPGPLFSTTLFRQSMFEKNRRSSDSTPMQHSRSRSVSVPGVHGSGSTNQSRRRSFTSKPNVPVPPLPSESMLEKMEERIQSSRNSTASERIEPTSSNFSSLSNQQSLSRRPSAKFMVPQHPSQAPFESLDGRRKSLSSS